jgi:hypothetical protein
MHGCTALRQEADDDARRGLVAKQLTCHLADRLMCGALAHADEDDALADWHHVATLHAGIHERLIRIAPPDFEVSALERWVELVNRSLQQRLRLAGGPEHRVAGHAAIDPAGWVALEQVFGLAPLRTVIHRSNLHHVLEVVPGRSEMAMPPIR